MSIKPQTYRPRLLDSRIERLLRVFGAVQIDGAKWCGKTWASMAHANSMIGLDEANVRTLVEDDPTIALTGDQPHLIDEWQELPQIRDAVRHAIDRNASRPGQYLLTGSSAPPLETYHHSGAGRIAHLRMRPMSLFEQGLSTGQISLRGLFEGEFATLQAHNTLRDIAEWVCRGGWPASMNLPLDDAMLIPDQYLSAVAEDNAPRAGKDPRLTRRIIASLARNNATAATMTTLSRDLHADDEDADKAPARQTTTSYIDMLIRDFLIEELSCWDAPVKSRNRVRVKPKRYFVDPSLAVAALGMNPDRLLTDGQTFGDMLENLVLRDILVYTSSWSDTGEARVFFYRDDTGLEADIIIELPDGRWGALEVKTGDSKVPDAVESLLNVSAKVTANPAARIPEPSFLAVVLGTGVAARRTREGVYVIPITLLGA